MTLRSPRERLLQTVAFETGGLVLVAPLYALITGAGSRESLVLIAALSLAVMLWSPFYNTAFDWLDRRLSGRLASDRPHGWRMVHALSLEIGTVAVTLPLVIVIGGYALPQALAIDLSLSLFYAAWGYGFHLAYDRWRPVRLVG